MFLVRAQKSKFIPKRSIENERACWLDIQVMLCGQAVVMTGFWEMKKMWFLNEHKSSLTPWKIWELSLHSVN